MVWKKVKEKMIFTFFVVFLAVANIFTQKYDNLQSVIDYARHLLN